MSLAVSAILTVIGTVVGAFGGFFAARWWQGRRSPAVGDPMEDGRLSAALAEIIGQLEAEEGTRSEGQLGEVYLEHILQEIQTLGGYSAVVLSDDAGLVVSGAGHEEDVELVAIEAAALGTASDRTQVFRQAILQVQPDEQWTLHRYFEVELGKLCISVRHQGAPPRAQALDGSLPAFTRVLAGRAETAA